MQVPVPRAWQPSGHLNVLYRPYTAHNHLTPAAAALHVPCRLFLSAEPPPALERGLPISLLQNSIKLTNEPPEGLRPNLRRAYLNFNEEIMESCAKQAEFRTIIFALCYFHAAILERKKFGVGNLPGATSGIGWNMNYPFNTGDLLCCAQTATNYLENNSKVRGGRGQGSGSGSSCRSQCTSLLSIDAMCSMSDRGCDMPQDCCTVWCPLQSRPSHTSTLFVP